MVSARLKRLARIDARFLTAFAALLLIPLICAPSAIADDKQSSEPAAMIWTYPKARAIYSTDLNGDRRKIVYSEAEGVFGIAVDVKDQKLYFNAWTDGPEDGHKIRVMDFGDGQVRDLVTGRTRIMDL